MIGIILVAAGAALVVVGAVLSWAVFTKPYLLALGVNLGSGMMALVGGLLLMALGFVWRELCRLRQLLTDAVRAPARNPLRSSATGEEDAAGKADAAPTPGVRLVEEREERGCPVRIYSDGSVEARLHEGWFRFEDMRHLHAYVDALRQGSKLP